MNRKVGIGVSVAFLLGLAGMMFWFYSGLNQQFDTYKDASGIIQCVCLGLLVVVIAVWLSGWKRSMR